MDIQARLARIQEQHRLSGILFGGSATTIVNPGELPYQGIRNPKERKKVYNRQYKRMWDILHPGKRAKACKKHYAKYPGEAAEAVKKNRKLHPEALAEALRRYRNTPEGRKAYAKATAKRRERTTDPELYAVRVCVLYNLQESCAQCGALHKPSFEIDHIIALCLDGTDVWENYQPLCPSCHNEKTKEDMCKFRERLRNAER